MSGVPEIKCAMCNRSMVQDAATAATIARLASLNAAYWAEACAWRFFVDEVEDSSWHEGWGNHSKNCNDAINATDAARRAAGETT